MRSRLLSLVLFLLVLSQAGVWGEMFEPLVVVYAGRMDYGNALVEIVNETGTRARLAESDATLRGLISLPQVKCVVIAAQNPSDFVFLREFSSVLRNYFLEGGSLVGIGPCCGPDLEELSGSLFPLRGNATKKGRPIDGGFGSEYVRCGDLEPITGSLPSRFVITQSEYSYRAGSSGPVDPVSGLGETRVLFRDRSQGAPMVVTLEKEKGGRTVSMPGCRVANVERLPFYWGNLVENQKFRLLLAGAVNWAMDGCNRYHFLAANAESDLSEERQRLQELVDEGESLREDAQRNRMMLLGALWSLGLVFQGFLVVKYILPAFRQS